MVRNSKSTAAKAILVRVVSVAQIICLAALVADFYGDSLSFGGGALIGIIFILLSVLNVSALAWHIVRAARRKEKIDKIAVSLFGMVVLSYIVVTLIVNVWDLD